MKNVMPELLKSKGKSFAIALLIGSEILQSRFTKLAVFRKLFLLIQENLCTASGLDCYKNMAPNYQNCIIPCTGLYADVEKDDDLSFIKQSKAFDELIENYTLFKQGFEGDEIFNKHLLTGMVNNFLYNPFS